MGRDAAVVGDGRSAPTTLAISWWLPLIAGLLLLSVATLLLWRRPKQELLTHTFTPFAMEAAEETDPAWSPDGRTITYAARIRGTRQIVTKALGSHNVVQITRGAQDCSNPFWSPDGRQIYYRIGVSLWAVRAAGGEPREVLQPIVQAASLSPAGTLAFIKGAGGNMSLWTAPASGTPQQHYRQAPFPDVFARVWSIDFSRDGSKLAMVMEREGDTGFVNELWVLPFPTGTPERIIAKVPFRISGANPGGHPNGRISWLPGHRHILLHAEMPDRAGIQLYLVDVERKAIEPLTSGVANARSASVSPDGDKVAFVSGGDDYDIVQVSIDGRTARPFLATATGEYHPAWAPSGRQFAYVHKGSSGSEIWVRSVQEELAFPLLRREEKQSPEWFSLGQLVFSPRGDRIAYDAVASKHMIWISPANGGSPVTLDQDSFDQHGPAWAPDGNWIAYLRFHGGEWAFVKAPVGGGVPVVLARNVGFGSASTWSPDGAWLAYQAGGKLSLIPNDENTHEPRRFAPAAEFGFSRDSSLLYVIRRGEDRDWSLTAVEVSSGKERSRVLLPIPSDSSIAGFSVHPDGKSFLTSINEPKSDIWLLEGLQQTVSRLK